MQLRLSRGRVALAAGALAVGVLAIATPIGASQRGYGGGTGATVTIPDEDRFGPYAVTIHVAQSVRWVNTDSDDHTIVSDDAFNTTDHRGANQLIAGTGEDGTDPPGVVNLRFTHPGTFVYFCRFHAHLDEANQPVAPGPDDGIETHGNFGTPMTGIVTVLP